MDDPSKFSKRKNELVIPLAISGEYIALENEKDGCSRKIHQAQEGQGMDTVLLHGFPDHSGTLYRLFHGLKNSARVFTYDQGGTGLSDKPVNLPYGLPFYVEELHQVLNAMGIQKALLIGHSIGGAISVFFAAKYPERVQGIVLMNPALKNFKIHTGMDRLGAWFLQLPVVGEIMLLFSPRWMTKACIKMAFFDESRVTEEIVDSYHIPFKIEDGKKCYLCGARSIYQIKDQEMLAQIDQVQKSAIPVQLLWTENDNSMSLKDGQFFAERIHGKIIPIARCGHSPHLELVDSRFRKEVIGPITQFIQELEQPPSIAKNRVQVPAPTGGISS